MYKILASLILSVLLLHADSNNTKSDNKNISLLISNKDEFGLGVELFDSLVIEGLFANGYGYAPNISWRSDSLYISAFYKYQFETNLDLYFGLGILFRSTLSEIQDYTPTFGVNYYLNKSFAIEGIIGYTLHEYYEETSSRLILKLYFW